MNIDELKIEFSKYYHPSWIELLAKGDFSGLKRNDCTKALSLIDSIREFKTQYESEITKINLEFTEKVLTFNEKNKIDDSGRIVTFIISTGVILFVSIFYLELDNILGGILSVFLGSLITGIIIGEQKIISADEHEENNWLILKDLEYFFKMEMEVKNRIKTIDKEKSKDYIQNMNPYNFEQLVSELFKYFGYTSKVTKGSGDKGIDINIEKDGIKEIVQCKRYKKKIGTPIIRDFIGTMNLSGVYRGYIVTTSDFSFEVVNLLRDKDHDIKLIDIETLITLYKAMNNGENPNFNQIISDGMGEISKSAANSELNQFVAKLNYRGSYYRKI